MKKLFLLVTVIGFFTLSSCGSTQNCRTRTTAENFKNLPIDHTTLAYAELK